MKNLTLMMLAGLCLTLVLFTPHAESAEKLDWMPPQLDDQTLNSQGFDSGQNIPKIVITKTPKKTAKMSKFKKKYTIELDKFNISNDGTNPAETSKGLNAALQHAKTLDANYIIFPKGTYLISETDPIVIDHKNTIIDLNGATLQINPNGSPKYMVVTFVEGAESARLTNGTLKGDRFEHDFSSGRSHGWGHCLVFEGGINLEADNLTLIDACGDGANTRTGGVKTTSGERSMAKVKHTIYPKDVEQGAFSKKGVKIDSTEKTRTIKALDLTSCDGEFEFGYTIEYMGYPYIKNRNYQVYFYNADMKFVKMKKCIQFRKVTIPKKAKFAHLELNQPEIPEKPAHIAADYDNFIGRITNLTPPRDVHFHNNKLINNRRLGLAYCGGQRWLVEDNYFEGNGKTIDGNAGTNPRYAIDFEDGWELMQDVVIKNNRFKDNHAGDLVICAGSEIIIEDNVFEKNVLVHGRPHNYIFRNNNYTGGRVGYTTRTGVAEIHDNTYENCSVSIVFDNKAVADGIYRKPGQVVATPPLMLEDETMTNVSRITGTYFNLKDCELTNSHFVAGKETRMANFEKCKFDGSSLEYTEDGPEVLATVKKCKGKLEEKGPGLKRKKLSQ